MPRKPPSKNYKIALKVPNHPKMGPVPRPVASVKQNRVPPPAPKVHTLPREATGTNIPTQNKIIVKQTWRGYNIHAYTSEIQTQIQSEIPKLISMYGNVVLNDVFESILCEMSQKYGPKVTYSNLRNNYKQGWIRDPELPGRNSAILLQAIWDILKSKDEARLYRHFNEKLNNIGSTCLAGVTNRLFMDYIAFTRD